MLGNLSAEGILITNLLKEPRRPGNSRAAPSGDEEIVKPQNALQTTPGISADMLSMLMLEWRMTEKPALNEF